MIEVDPRSVHLAAKAGASRDVGQPDPRQVNVDEPRRIARCSAAGDRATRTRVRNGYVEETRRACVEDDAIGAGDGRRGEGAVVGNHGGEIAT